MQISLKHIHWKYLSDEAQQLFSYFEKSGVNTKVFKSSPRRSTVLVGKKIFVKEVYYSGFDSVIKGIATGNACKEGENLSILQSLGISVPGVIAYGEEKHFGLLKRDVLVTKRIPDSMTLSVFMKRYYPQLPAKQKRKLIRDFASFIKSLHEAGIFQEDLHIGNILLKHEKQENSFSLVDAQRVRFHPGSLSSDRKGKNLAILLSNFWTLSTVLERFWFLKCYGIKISTEGGKNFVRKVEKIGTALSSKVWLKKAKRCLYSNKRFCKEESGAFKIYRKRNAQTEQILKELLPNPDKRLDNGIILKNGRTVKAAKVELDGHPYFLKRYNCKGLTYRLRNAFRTSRAVRTWFVSWAFKVRGLPVPMPLICLEERRFRLLERSYILYEFIDNVESLPRVWKKLGNSDRGKLLKKLRKLFDQMHMLGGFHGDLKWNNILIKLDDSPESIFLIDLDGSRFFREKAPVRKSSKDINRFLHDLEKMEGKSI